MKIPRSSPGLPSPGPKAPGPSITDLITLETFGVSSEPDTISLHARAAVIVPKLLSFNLSLPTLPFTILLPFTTNGTTTSIPVAAIHTQPLSLTRPNTTIDMAGTVLPIQSSSSSMLSSFIANYLRGQSSPIVVSNPYFPSYIIETNFPGPNPKPKILRNVTIHSMKLVARGTSFLASGTIYARVVLPRGLDISLNVTRVLPDVLVFDGEVPSLYSDSPNLKDSDPAPPLPDPLPDRAFARIRPDAWLNSASEIDEAPDEEGSGSVYTVTAELVEVPLQVLPDRESAFSNFVRKVVFGNGAVAGLLGSAAVAITVEGFPTGGQPGEMELSGLPFRGAVFIKKKGL